MPMAEATKAEESTKNEDERRKFAKAREYLSKGEYPANTARLIRWGYGDGKRIFGSLIGIAQLCWQLDRRQVGGRSNKIGRHSDKYMYRYAAVHT